MDKKKKVGNVLFVASILMAYNSGIRELAEKHGRKRFDSIEPLDFLLKNKIIKKKEYNKMQKLLDFNQYKNV